MSDESHDWELADTETYVEDQRTVKTEDVSINTVMHCPECKFHNHLRNGKCVKCDMGWA
jgi:hypothetical protein